MNLMDRSTRLKIIHLIQLKKFIFYATAINTDLTI
jgi:hypothetical protein